jgi:hypothetical protein
MHVELLSFATEVLLQLSNGIGDGRWGSAFRRALRLRR